MPTLQSRWDSSLEQKTADTYGVAASVLADIVAAADAAADAQADIDAHAALTNNPHATSIANVGGGTLAQLNTAISDADVVALAGQLGGSAASPDVRGVRETSGPTLLTLGAIADGDILRRVGAAALGITPSALRSLMRPSTLWKPENVISDGTVSNGSSRRLVAHYIGLVPAGRTIRAVRFHCSTLATGSGQAEVALATSAAAPSGSAPDLTPVAASVTQSLVSPGTAGAKRNNVDLAYTPGSDVHLWTMFRAEFGTTQGQYLTVPGSGLMDVGTYHSAVRINTDDLTTLIGTPLTMDAWAGQTAVVYTLATEFF